MEILQPIPQHLLAPDQTWICGVAEHKYAPLHMQSILIFNGAKQTQIREKKKNLKIS